MAKPQRKNVEGIVVATLPELRQISKSAPHFAKNLEGVSDEQKIVALLNPQQGQNLNLVPTKRKLLF
jgi:hypothetical protein